jgi:malate dehydrogenase
VRCEGGNYSIIQGLEVNPFSRQKMDATAAELSDERQAVRDLGLI